MENRVVGYVFSENTGMQMKPKIISQTSKTITYDTILQEGDTENRNKRIYPSALLEAGFKSAYVQERLKTNSWAGEAEHPMGGDRERLFRIERSNIDHFIREWKREGKLFKGRIQTAANRMGTDLMNMILENDLVTGTSLRASGPVKNENGKQIVCGPFRMITYDNVSHPSHSPAYADMISKQSKSTVVPITESDLSYLGEKDGFLMENADFLTQLKDVDFEVANFGGTPVLIGNQNGSRVAINIKESTRFMLRDMLF